MLESGVIAKTVIDFYDIIYVFAQELAIMYLYIGGNGGIHRHKLCSVEVLFLVGNFLSCTVFLRFYYRFFLLIYICNDCIYFLIPNLNKYMF